MAKKLNKTDEKVLKFLCEQQDTTKEMALERIAEGVGLPERAVRESLQRLKEAGMVGGGPDVLDRAAELLRKLDENFGPASRGYAEHIVLLASLWEGADESHLSKILGYEDEFVRTVGSRLRNAGIWKGAELSPDRRKEWEKSAVSFFLSGAVAVGDLMLVGEVNGQPQYTITEGGAKQARRLMGFD